MKTRKKQSTIICPTCEKKIKSQALHNRNSHPIVVTPIVSEAPAAPAFPHEKLRDALMFAQDCLDRADIPYFVWGKTAEHVVNNEESLEGDTEITLAVVRAEVTKGHVSILEHWAKEISQSEKMIEFSHYQIPIKLHIIDGDYEFLKRPDIKYYWVENFRIPNPFQEYLNVRNEIT